MKALLAEVIAAGGPRSEAEFDALALALFRAQRVLNADYGRFSGSEEPTCWAEIPAVPVGLFRDLALTCFPPDEARVLFRTSGTTSGRRGVHRLRDTDLYDLGSLRHARAVLGPIPQAGVSLVTHAPDSSLGHMVALFAPGLTRAFDLGTGLDHALAWSALRAARQPVFVPATAFALADLLYPDGQPPAEPCPLPEGSIVMVTGGFKGWRRRVDEAELTRRALGAFPGARVVGEYGMTELSSQLWADPLGAPFLPPPWMRVLAVDPLSGQPAPEGQLRFFDLANHDTVLAVETQDLGRVLPDGRVVLLGRLQDAPARGCSITVEEAGRGPR